MKLNILKIAFIGSITFVFTSCQKETIEKESLSESAIKFNEEEIAFAPEIANTLGYDNIITSEGEYEVDYDYENYGTVIFNLKQAAKATNNQLKSQPDGVGIKIRIASRKKGCMEGIGFRCGLVSHTSFIDPDRDKLARIQIDETNEIVHIEFLEPVDWEKLNNN